MIHMLTDPEVVGVVLLLAVLVAAGALLDRGDR